MKKSNKYVVTALSHDRVGIISNLTGSVFQLKGNIDRISQTVIDGCFTILLTAVFPLNVTQEKLQETITRNGKRLDLDISVRPYTPASAKKMSETGVYFLTVTGADRKGIFHEITNCLAGYGINIQDLYCSIRPTESRKGEDFVLVSEILVPDGVDLEQVRIDIEATGVTQAISVRIQHQNLFQATNDLYLTQPEQEN